MNKIILAVTLSLVWTVPAVAAPDESSCGDPHQIVELYRPAVYSADASAAEASLIRALFPVITCLSRGDDFEQPQLKGRFAIVLQVLATLRHQRLHMSDSSDVDRMVGLWEANAPGAGR